MAFSKLHGTTDQVLQYVDSFRLLSSTNVVCFLEPNVSFQKDWQVLASQSSSSVLRVSSLTCDPLSSRLIDDTDAERFFEL